MTGAETIPAVVLKRKAVVYVRQSTQSQVMTNLESKRDPPPLPSGTREPQCMAQLQIDDCMRAQR